MSLNLWFSNKTDVLLNKLIEVLEHNTQDPFNPPSIIIPGNSAYKWLQLRLAEKKGVVLGNEKLLADNFLWHLLKPESHQVLLDSSILQQIVHQKINQILKHEINNDYTPLKDYLIQREQIQASKLIQLSQSLSKLYLKYLANRPSVYNIRGQIYVKGLDQTWASDELYFSLNAPHNIQIIEKWQLKLFNDIFAHTPGKIKIDENLEYITLTALYHDRITSNTIFSEIDQSKPDIFFFPYGMNHFHRNIILHLSRIKEIHLLQLNPCSNFWEDVDTRRMKKVNYSWTDSNNQKLKFKDPEKDYLEEQFNDLHFKESAPSFHADMPLLELWGHTGKENITLLCQASNYNFEFLESPIEEPKSVLENVQKMILEREATLETKIKQDHSIQVWGAPDFLRECEQLKENVYHLLKEDSGLRLQDFTILVPSLDQYTPALHRVFGEASPSGDIPYIIGDEKSGNSFFSQAAKAFINLFQSNLNRKLVLQFLRNPLVRNSIGIDRQTLSVWEKWFDDLNIFHSWDKQHRHTLEDNEPNELHTWKWGLERLLAGSISRETLTVSIPSSEHDSVRLPYFDIETSNTDQLELLIDTMTTLHSDLLRISSTEKLSIDEQVEILEIIFRRWISIDKKHMSEKSIMNTFFTELRLLEVQKLVHQETEDNALPIEELKEYLNALLNNNLPGNATLHTGKLCIQEFKSRVILPNKIYYLLGMNGSDFPGQISDSTINLLAYKRIIGDMHPVRERQYLFLEALVSTEKKLIISYRNENILQDKVLPASSSVLELISFLNESVLTNRFIENRVSLVEHEAILNSTTKSSDSINYTALATAEILSKLQTRISDRTSFLKTVQSVNSTHPEKLNDTTVIEVSIPQIVKFLSNPLEWYLKNVLNISSFSKEGDSANKEWERISGDHLQNYHLLDKCVGIILNKKEINDSLDKDDIMNEIESLIINKTIVEGDSPQATMLRLWNDDKKTLLKTFFFKLMNYFESYSNFVHEIDKEISLDLSAPTTEQKYHIKGNIKLISHDKKNNNHYLGLFSASTLYQNNKWKDDKAKYLIEPWVHSLLLWANNSTSEKISLSVIDKNKELKTETLHPPENTEHCNIATESLNILKNILSLMYQYTYEENHNYYNIPINHIFELRKQIDNNFEYSLFHENLSTKEDSDQHKTSNEIKLTHLTDPNTEEWVHLLNTLYIPFINSIKEIK